MFRKNSQFPNGNTTIDFVFLFIAKQSEDTKEEIKICKSYQNSQTQRLEEPGKEDKQWSSTAQKTLNNTNFTRNRGQTQMLWKDNHFLNDNKTIAYYYFSL